MDIDEVDIQVTSKANWKLVTSNAIENKAFKSLKTECRSHGKTSHLNYNTFEPQPYLFSCPTDVASFLFRLRSRSLNCRNNHHKEHPNLTCRICHVEIESQQHIVNCRSVFSKESHLILDELFDENLKPNIPFVRRIMARYSSFHETNHT